MANHPSTQKMTFNEALEFTEYTLNEDGSLSCDLGDGNLIPLYERNVRAEIQTLDMFLDFSTPHPDSPTVLNVENLNRFKGAYSVILDYIMSRPGHVPDSEIPDPEWKKSVRDYHVSELDEAMDQLNLHRNSTGGYYHIDGNGNHCLVDREYCERDISRLESTKPANDEGIYFWPFHNNRMMIESARLILENLENATV